MPHKTNSNASKSHVPDGWIEVCVQDAVRVVDYRGRTPPFSETGIPHLRSNNVKNGKVVWQDLRYVTKETYDRYMTRGLPEKGDLLFTTEAPLGHVALVPDEEFCIAQRMMILKPLRDVLLPKFLMYQIQSERFQRLLRQMGTGTTVKGVSSRNFRPLPLSVAPISQQKRIVDRIEELFSDLDAGVETLNLVQQQLKVYRQAVLKWAFEGKLGDISVCTSSDSALEFLAALKKGNSNKKFIAPLTDEEIRQLANLPAGWCWTTAGEICDIKGGIALGKKHKSNDELVELPYLRVANVQRGWLDLNEIKKVAVTATEAKMLLLEHGDILMNEGGDRDKLGRGWVWEGQIPTCIHQNHVFRLRVKGPGALSKFISYYSNAFGQQYFIEQGKQTTNLASISMSRLARLPIPIPPLSVLSQIVDAIERQVATLEHLEAEIEEIDLRQASLRASILRSAFQGTLVPRNANDEPAHELLKRIAEQRSKEAVLSLPATNKQQTKKKAHALVKV